MKKQAILLIIGGIISSVGIGAAIANISHIKNKQQEPKITLSVSVSEANIIFKGLGKLQLEEAITLYINLSKQAESQINSFQQKQLPSIQVPDSSAGKNKKKN